MTKTELVDHVCKNNSGLTKKAGAEIIDAVFEAVQESIKKDEKFAYPGFGTFVVRSRKARTGRDPRTGKEIKIKASKTVGFKPARAFKEQL
ncbi:MAG: HU family DNA-binding protein [Myxococcaceae bacterium]|nr:HU family DNA-binding protein [Myxococcaceae bacterium]MBH2006705.1 HU family DNA-binding protein [Myxococcaceae bacterium]